MDGFANLVPNPDEDQGYTVMKGEIWYAIATASPEGVKATPSGIPVGSVAGSENLVPNPAEDQGYANILGLDEDDMTIVSPEGLNVTSAPVPIANVEGSGNLVPNPDEDQGYAVIYGEVACAIAIYCCLGLVEEPNNDCHSILCVSYSCAVNRCSHFP